MLSFGIDAAAHSASCNLAVLDDCALDTIDELNGLDVSDKTGEPSAELFLGLSIDSIDCSVVRCGSCDDVFVSFVILVISLIESSYALPLWFAHGTSHTPSNS